MAQVCEGSGRKRGGRKLWPGLFVGQSIGQFVPISQTHPAETPMTTVLLKRHRVITLKQ